MLAKPWIHLALFVSSCVAACASATEPKRPNIVFAFADDWGRYAGAYAAADGAGSINDVVRTPNFDRIAREGALFRRAFVSAPSCTPCRSALLTGRHFWTTGRGAILRGAIWDGSIPSFPHALRDAGYMIGETYKVWSPGLPVDAPFGAGKYAYERAGGRFNQFSQNVTKQVAEGRPLEEAKQSLYAEVQGNFDAVLAARKANEPFLWWFGPTNVHRKWVKGSGKALWGIDPESLRGKLPPFLPDVPVVREDVADYLGEIQAFDAALGVILRRLEEIGELENTWIVVSGDHGPPGFPHGKCNLYDFGSSVSLAIRGPGVKPGRTVDDLVSLADLAPTFLAIAGLPPLEGMTGRSLMPLLESPASGTIDPKRDAVFIGRERHVEDARKGYLPYPQRAIRTKSHLYIINFHPERYPLGDPYRLDGENPPTAEEITENTRVTLPDDDAGPTKAWLVGVRRDAHWKPYFDRAFGKRPREELYDLATDPHQMRNVAADPAFVEVRGGLERRLLDELKRTGDPRVVGDGRYFEEPPLAGPVSEPAAKKKGRRN
ncbi:MAG: sulfatase [Isosphaeraceae bacterium]|nr:sulfatase [Isosphaeraceae bacterium]